MVSQSKCLFKAEIIGKTLVLQKIKLGKIQQ